MEEKVGTDGETERRPKGRSGWREREKKMKGEWSESGKVRSGRKIEGRNHKTF